MNFIDYFLNIALPKEKNRIFLEAEGGFGKSTSLRYLCKELIKIGFPSKSLIVRLDDHRNVHENQ